MTEAIISKMINALDLEIKAIEKKGMSSSVQVRGGERRGTADGHVLYAFSVTEEISLRDESRIRAVVDQGEAYGKVVSFGEGLLLIALEHDLGPKLPIASLTPVDSFLVEQLKKKLEEVRTGRTSFNQKRATQTIGEEPSRSAKVAVDQALTLGGEPLNDEQKAAIATALGSEITYIWGPPGTGKTTVLARIVEGYYRLGLSVLVVSNTNMAVDTALLDRSRGMDSMRRSLSRLETERLRADIRRAEAECATQEDAFFAVRREVQRLQEAEEQVLAGLTKTVPCASCRTANRILPFQGKTRPICERCGKPLSLDGLNLNLADYRQRLQDSEKKIEDLKRRINEIQKQLDALRDEILKQCKILATTVYRTYLKGQVERSFDAVIIDEASMLVLPLVFYAAGLASRHVVIMGDFRQLPPVVISKEGEVAEWLKRDVFRKAGIAAAVRQGGQPESLVALRTQYRMHEDICSVINHIFYSDHPLETAASIRHRGADHFPLGDSALLYVDTGRFHPWAARGLRKSRYNVLHALLLRNLACHLEKRGYLPPIGSANEALGALALYTAQVNLVQRLLDERLDNRGTQLAATVHRFQGNQKDTILIDLTDSDGEKPSQFVRAVDLDEDGARLRNVALSRARYHVVLVANFGYLRQKLDQNSVVRKILDRVEQLGEPLNGEDLLSLGPEDWFDGLRPLEPLPIEFDISTAGFFTEGTFYRAFYQDLNRAAKSVVIFSPFLAPEGAGRWMGILGAKVEQGVPIRLVTRPPGKRGGDLEEGLQELIAAISKLGVVVDLRALMHEKFAIIDNAILWHGSLNILAHGDTSESMLRIPSSAACSQMAQMARLVTSPARLKQAEKKTRTSI